jgi:hypothetical protein
MPATQPLDPQRLPKIEDMQEEKSFFSFKFEEPAPKKRRRPKRLRAGPRPVLTIGQILQWADAHYERTGKWPNTASGWVHENRDEKWKTIDTTLRKGGRGLPSMRGLARLLIELRGARIPNCPPPLTEAMILEMADAFRQRTGDWPSVATDANWASIDNALSRGARSLPGGSTLARFLQERRGRPHLHNQPGLTVKQILIWADAHQARTGDWPNQSSGCVQENNDEKWGNINNALRLGRRGLPRHGGLASLLMAKRGVRNLKGLPRLTEAGILKWADAHHARTGQWPDLTSGLVHDNPNESWKNVDNILRRGGRGLPDGGSLAKLLIERRGARCRRRPPPLTEAMILNWADDHHQRTGAWPAEGSGAVAAADGETWCNVSQALKKGLRGPRGRSSLAQLLSARRGKRNKKRLPPLTVGRILRWADAYRRATGSWPTQNSGSVAGSSGETWVNINQALIKGLRSLPAGLSLARILAEHRGRRK